ncbi:MAG: ABC transporter ATP-binding protein [Clostridia bacterium BRH_c25]|nr:MAG: ABC transporter ATP-binding protein [Clostridia bacterium BRH_c25]
MSADILSMKGITKVYPNGIVANKEVDFSIKQGEIHALMGENGAGKSTLMKILFGLEQPEEGSIILKEEKISITSPHIAIKYGIGMVHQHFMLVPSLTVAENMVLGIEPRKSGLLNIHKAVEITENLSKQYNLNVDPKAKIQDLAVGTKQKVEILKALLRGAEILILDEPTAVLTPQETEELFQELLSLKSKGHTIIFISHKLNEIKQISDRITIMRNGRNVGVFNTADVSREEISRLMVGRDVILKVNKSKAEPKDAVLNIKALNYTNEVGKKVLKDVSLYVRSGEILGIAGVEGNGQRELVEITTGLRRCSSGVVEINGQLINNLTIKQIRDLKTSHIPEDRMTYGVSSDGSIEENLISDRYDKKELNKSIFLNKSRISELSQSLVKQFKVKCNSPRQSVKMLSGGNIQKVVVAREFTADPRLLVADQPTRGIDVGATEFIRNKIIEMRDSGTAILLISADLNEVLELSDSLVVMYGGEIVAYFEEASQVNEVELGTYMLGLKTQTKEEVGRVAHA